MGLRAHCVYLGRPFRLILNDAPDRIKYARKINPAKRRNPGETGMDNELEFNKAPRANIETYEGMLSLIKISSVGIVIVLALMAMFLTG